MSAPLPDDWRAVPGIEMPPARAINDLLERKDRELASLRPKPAVGTHGAANFGETTFG